MSTPTRPRQTTFAGGMIIVGSIFLLLTVWESMTGLRGIESRDAVEDFLAESPGSETGLTVEGTLQLLRGVSTVAGVCAAVAAVLGVYALRGHRPARVGLSVLAVPLFVTGIAAGGFMSSIVAVAIALLWLSPSREWFKGEVAPDRAASDKAAESVWPPPLPPYDASSSSPSPSGSTSSSPAGSAGPAGPAAPVPPPAGDGPPAPSQPGPYAHPFGEPPTQHGTWPSLPTAPSPDRRPEGVVLAFVLTLVSAGLVLVLVSISVLVMAVSPDLMLEEVLRQQPELADQGVTQAMLQTTTFVMGGVVIAWAAAAIVLAFLTLGRRRVAAQLLMVSAALSAVLCVVGTFASLLLALPAFASIVTVAVLRRPDVRAWLAGAPR
ncbi:hypothetical protein [Nocardioides terrigena]|uniref:hypothetical protein n=1 Tax=Nocardioides terrigena TaxID=424797 RepID=UPI000D321ABA|nr:hypothetical protein [Nocardioides terrigena]